MQNNRISYGYWDQPCRVAKTSTATPPDVVEKIIDAFVTYTAKGVEHNQFVPVFEKIVAGIVPKHTIMVNVQKKPFAPPNTMRALSLGQPETKEYFDINLAFQPIIYTNGIGLF